ncbi:MAG: hypothetical protein MET45_23855 [Nostoc sp. LLA-1]|nr:hypothetical protein [Cyanocohniella sp. LLY]
MSPNKSLKSVYANKLVINSLVMFAMLIGLSPYFIIIERPELLIYLTMGLLIVPVLTSRVKAFQTLSERVPKPIEFLLNGISSIFWPAVASFMGGIIYWLIIGVSNLVQYIFAQFKLDVQVELELPAFCFSFAIVVFYTFVSIYFVTDYLVKQLYLYPQTTDTRSVSKQPAQLVLVGIFIFLLLSYIRLMVILSVSWWLNFYWLLYLICLSYRLARQELLTPKVLREKAVAAVKKLFEVTGYEVNSSFRTGKIEIDPLLTDLDLVVFKGEHGFAIEVIIASTSSKITYQAAIFALITASWTLTNFFQESDHEPAPYVKPLFVFVASNQFPSLKVPDQIAAWMEEETELQVVNIEHWNEIDRILKLEDLKQLQLIAQEDFKIPQVFNNDF